MTRARSEMVVFSTLSPDQINLGRTKASAVADLKHFLEYAGVALLHWGQLYMVHWETLNHRLKWRLPEVCSKRLDRSSSGWGFAYRIDLDYFASGYSRHLFVWC